MDTRVTVTEDNVGKISKDVSKNKSDIKQVKGDVSKQGKKLDDLKTVVDETVEKVEVIDHKVSLFIILIISRSRYLISKYTLMLDTFAIKNESSLASSSYRPYQD